MGLQRRTWRALTAGGLAFTTAAAVLGPQSTALASPHLDVHGDSRFEAEASPSKGTLAVSGALLDDADHAIGEASIAVAFVAEDGALLVARGCDGSSLPRAPTNDAAWSLTTQSDGTFCARTEARLGTTKITLAWPGTPLFTAAHKDLSVDASRRAVTLAFDPEPRVLALGEGSIVIDAVAKTATDDNFAAGAGLTLQLSDERGAALGDATTDGAGRARFVVPSRTLGPPGPGEVRLLFAGDKEDAPTTKVLATERRARVLVTPSVTNAMAADTPAIEDDEGVALDLDVRLVTGESVAGGSVEGLLGGAVIGVAPVSNGHAHLVVRPPDGAPSHVEARYVPELPWYVAGPPSVVTLTFRRTTLWKRLAITLGGLAIFAWFFVSRSRLWNPRPRRPPRPTRSVASEEARIDVITQHEGAERGWEGRAVDAHDGEVVRGAVITLERADFGSLRVLAEASTDDRGHFTLPSTRVQPGDSFAAQGPLHVRFSRAVPPPGVLAVALISRRRTLLRRLVDWARQRGAPFDIQPEPTPAHVKRAAGEDAHTARWAAATEAAAFGSGAVDVSVEAEVDRLGHPNREPGNPNVPRS